MFAGWQLAVKIKSINLSFLVSFLIEDDDDDDDHDDVYVK